MNPSAHPIRLLRCLDCGRLDSPGRIVCVGCLSVRLQEHLADGAGTVATHTTIRRAPSRLREEAPYEVVVVDLDCGVRVTGRLHRDSPPATMGSRVQAIAGDASGLLFSLEV